MGSFAIQYCKHELGMEVVATCSAANADFCRSLGADRVVDYSRQRFEDEVRDCDVVFDPMSYLYEQRTLSSPTVLKKVQCAQIFASDTCDCNLYCVILQGGHYINVASSSNALQAENRDPFGLAIPEARPDKMLGKFAAYFFSNVLHMVGLSRHSYEFRFVNPDGKDMVTVSRLVAEGKVRAVIDSVYDIGEAAKAHEHVEKGHSKGKVVIRVAQRDEDDDSESDGAAERKEGWREELS